MDTKPWSGFRARLYSLIFRSPKTNRLIVQLAELTATDRALDIGCGPGAAVRFAADIVVDGVAVGIDRAQPMVDIARRRSRSYSNTKFEVGSAEAVPFEDGAFTVVWTAHSFHHWEDRRAGLTEMYRVLDGGGRALILEQDGKKHGLTADEAERVATDLDHVGFRSIDVSRVDKQVVISARTEPAQ
jgi:ubiquinone/menaquinone biosynthesis C-methylase UbiE